MQGRLMGIGEAISAAWATFMKYPGILLGIFVVYLIIVGGGGSIPFIGGIVNIFIAPPLVGGAIIAGLKAIRGQAPDFNDLFVGFRKYWQWMGVYWLSAAIMAATMIPLGIGAGIAGALGAIVHPHAASASPDITPAGIAIIGVAGLVSLVLYVIFGIRYMFALYEAADGAEILDALKRSEELTRNVRLNLLGYAIVFGLFSAVGVIACGVGVILTSLLSYLAFMHVYVALKAEQPQIAMTEATQPQ